MVAKLISEEGDLTGLTLLLENDNEWTIGRDSEECQLVIPDPLISRKQALAYSSPEGIYLKNLSETNPTKVNDEEIGSDAVLLHHGDNIQFGNEIFRYYTESDAHILDKEYPSKIVSNDPEQGVSSEKEIETSFEPDKKIQANEYSPDNKSSDADTEVQSSTENMDRIDEDSEENYPTILENEEEFAPLAEINFGLADFGRWLVKVVNGPNNGAEFYMQSGYSYILGTDSNLCDIVFHDKSVSRQHAKITVTEEDQLLIEDLNSKNGVLVDGKQIEGSQTLEPTHLVSIGTTSFIVYDREGEMQTIISPLLPSIVKVLQDEHRSTVPEEVEPFTPNVSEVSEEPIPAPPEQKSHFGKTLLVGSLIGLFVILGIGTASLFKNTPVVKIENAQADEMLKKAMTPYPTVKWAYNKATGGVLLLGHVSTTAEKNQLLYTLQSMPTIVKSVDESGLIIDEGVWREINSILSKNAAWQGITIHSPEAGKFVLSGTLKTRQQAEQLYDYIGINFPYLDLLKRDVLVEEDVLNQINGWLIAAGLTQVVPKMVDGEVSLSGNIPTSLEPQLATIIAKIKTISGVRTVYNFTQSKSADASVKNISSQYQVTGNTKVGSTYTVQINGRILSEGDHLDTMTITKITPNAVLLEDADRKYRIDYKG